MSGIEDDIKPDNDEKIGDLYKTSELLLDEQYWKRKTILNAYQIPAFTTLSTIGELYDIPFVKNWVSNYAEFMTSKGGKGRNDIVEIAKFNYKQQQDTNKELMGLIRGKR